MPGSYALMLRCLVALYFGIVHSQPSPSLPALPPSPTFAFGPSPSPPPPPPSPVVTTPLLPPPPSPPSLPTARPPSPAAAAAQTTITVGAATFLLYAQPRVGCHLDDFCNSSCSLGPATCWPASFTGPAELEAVDSLAWQVPGGRVYIGSQALLTASSTTPSISFLDGASTAYFSLVDPSPDFDATAQLGRPQVGLYKAGGSLAVGVPQLAFQANCDLTSLPVICNLQASSAATAAPPGFPPAGPSPSPASAIPPCPSTSPPGPTLGPPSRSPPQLSSPPLPATSLSPTHPNARSRTCSALEPPPTPYPAPPAPLAPAGELWAGGSPDLADLAAPPPGPPSHPGSPPGPPAALVMAWAAGPELQITPTTIAASTLTFTLGRGRQTKPGSEARGGAGASTTLHPGPAGGEQGAQGGGEQGAQGGGEQGAQGGGEQGAQGGGAALATSLLHSVVCSLGAATLGSSALTATVTATSALYSAASTTSLLSLGS
ncbi:hypothetical protein V8C86DRAFT_3144185 [Haematococcus lacustris]